MQLHSKRQATQQASREIERNEEGEEKEKKKLTFSLICLNSVVSLNPRTFQYNPLNQLFSTG